MIRILEKTSENMRKTRVRVPIIAVSASLVEEHRFEYIECGFDGWILKPIDFSRLDFLMRGIKDEELKKAQYSSGTWEQGGWFLP
jgi:DNA-binding response OmpR family regulator